MYVCAACAQRPAAPEPRCRPPPPPSSRPALPCRWRSPSPSHHHRPSCSTTQPSRTSLTWRWVGGCGVGAAGREGRVGLIAAQDDEHPPAFDVMGVVGLMAAQDDAHPPAGRANDGSLAAGAAHACIKALDAGAQVRVPALCRHTQRHRHRALPALVGGPASRKPHGQAGGRAGRQASRPRGHGGSASLVTAHTPQAPTPPQAPRHPHPARACHARVPCHPAHWVCNNTTGQHAAARCRVGGQPRHPALPAVPRPRAQRAKHEPQRVRTGARVWVPVAGYGPDVRWCGRRVTRREGGGGGTGLPGDRARCVSRQARLARKALALCVAEQRCFWGGLFSHSFGRGPLPGCAPGPPARANARTQAPPAHLLPARCA